MALFSRLRVTRPIGAGSFCLIVIAVALILFALPYPPLDQARRLVEIVRSDQKFVMVGASTMTYVSKCDQDQRAVPQMLADMTGVRFLDLARSGQPVADSLNLAADVAAKRTVTDVFLPISYSRLDEWTTPPYRKLLMYEIAAPGFSVFHASGLADFWSGVSDQPMRYFRGFSFEGHDYPDYRKVATTAFIREQQLSSCPEQVMRDPEFGRRYFWWTHVKTVVNTNFYDMAAEVKATLAAKGKRLHVVVLPANLELLATMDPSWPDLVQQGQDHVVAELSRRGLDVLDLSRGFGADEFSTQWCACIHMNQKGRLHLAQAIARDVRSIVATAPLSHERSRQSVVLESGPIDVR